MKNVGSDLMGNTVFVGCFYWCFALARRCVIRLLAIAITMATLVAVTEVSAAPSPDEALPPATTPPSLQQLRPTRFDLLDRSLEDLLNDGFGIVGFTALTVGPGVVLQQGGRRWVFCLLLISTPPGSPTAATSKCWALN
jgi:hypothetical protein